MENGALGKKFDAYPQRQSHNQVSAHESLACASAPPPSRNPNLRQKWLKLGKIWYQSKLIIAVFDFCAFTNIWDAAEDNICCFVKIAVSFA